MKSFLFTALLMTGANSWAALSEFANSSSRPLNESRTQFKPIPFDGIYRFRSDAVVKPKVEYINGLKVIDPDQPSISLNRNEPVAVRMLPSGDFEISLLLPDDERGTIPERIAVSAEEFAKLDLDYKTQGNAVDLKRYFSNEEEVQVARRGGGARGSVRRHKRFSDGTGYYGCLGWVCNSLGGCSGKIGGGKGMTNYLRRQGWRPVSCSNPPIGAVASWTGGGRGSGHTGRWNGSGWCYDLGCADPGSKFRLKDCVAK
jgi:hypothetical protein